MRTIGTVKISTNPAPSRMRDDSESARTNCRAGIRCSQIVNVATVISIDAGRYSGVVTAEISVPKIDGQVISTALSQSPSGRSRSRVRTSNPATITYGDQARHSDILARLLSK